MREKVRRVTGPNACQVSFRNGLFFVNARHGQTEVDQIYYGVVATYEKPFSLDNKEAISRNMLLMRMVKNSAVTFAYPDDAKRNLQVQRKQ